MIQHRIRNTQWIALQKTIDSWDILNEANNVVASSLITSVTRQAIHEPLSRPVIFHIYYQLSITCSTKRRGGGKKKKERKENHLRHKLTELPSHHLLGDV